MAYWKKLKNTDAVPVLKDELVFDTTPTVNSTNPVTSDGVARAIAGASGEVPAVTENDSGKVLTAIYDAGGPAVEWGEPAPEYTAGHGIAIDGNKVISAVGGTGITVTSSSTQTIELEMPCYSNQWVPGLAIGSGLTMLTPDLLGEVANGIDVTTDVALSADVTQSSGGTSGVVAYAAIFKINSDHSISKANRLVLDEITVFDWNTSDTYIGIDSGAVITYNSAHVNTTYSTITLADVEAAPTNYALGVFIYNPNGMGSFQYDTMSIETTAGASDPTMLVTSSYGKSVPGGAITVTTPVPVPQPSDNGKVLGVRNTSGALGWVAQPADELPSISGNAGKVLKVNSGATGVEWGDAGSNYSAGAGIAISEQGAISAVGGTGITVTAGSTVQKTLTAHTQDYVPSWTSTEQHMVTYMSLLDSALVADIQNGGIDVTLAYPFEQFASRDGGSEYFDDWGDHMSYFKAYAAIVELQTLTYSSGPTYWGSTANRLVLGEITSQWADPSGAYPTILANTVVNYDFADVNSSLSTITLADVLANPGNYCLTVLFLDTYGNLNEFDDRYSPYTCTVLTSYLSGSGDYTTGSYTAMSPSAITVTNPVPAYAAGDAGKVLQVNASGTGVQWTNYVQAEVVQALPANPTSGVLYIVTGA